MSNLLMERDHFERGLDAVADAFADDTVVSDVVNMKDHESVRFIVHWGVGTTGTLTLKVEACDDVTPSNTSSIPFFTRTNKLGVVSAITRATAAAGVLTVAGSSQIIECEVLAEELAATGYGYVRLQVTETVDAALLGGIIVQMGHKRHSSTAAPTSALT
jgi:hypothetical protein